MTNTNPILRVITALLGTLFALFVGTHALAAETDGDNEGIEEIIVTATYRDTNLMDTPQSITAITDSFVEDLGAQSMSDIYTMVAGLNFNGSRDGDNRYTVRGVTSQTGATGYFQTSATIGIYLDGTPMTSALGPDKQVSGNLFDIDRVEILKGPQGTLFGEGSQGGTIRYLYKQPDTSELDAAVNASFATMDESDDNSSRLDAMVNIPFADGQAALRLTGWQSESAGFIDNLAPFEEDYNTAKSTGGRAVLKWEVNDTLSLTGSIYHNKQESEGGTATQRAYENSSVRLPGLIPESADEIDLFSFIVDAEFNWGSFKSMTSYTDRSITATYEFSAETVYILDFFYGGSTDAGGHPDCGATPLCPGFPGFFNLGDPSATIPDGQNLIGLDGFIDSYSKRWVQEFRFVSPDDQRLRWIVGAFWKDSEDHGQSQQQGLYFADRISSYGDRLDTLLQVPANTHTDTIEEFAVFGEVAYDLTEEIELTLGLRLSDLEQGFSNTATGTDDKPVSPKFVVSWRPFDEFMTYFRYSTGFRPGQVNNHMEFNFRQYDLLIAERAALGLDTSQLEADQIVARSRRFFDGDEVHAYEVGAKTTFFDGRVRLMGAVYFLDWKDMIMVENDPQVGASNPLSFYNTNSGGAEIKGVELEVSALVTDRLTVRIAGDFNDTEVTSSVLFATGNTGGQTKGNELIYAPNYSASLALDYEIPLGNGWALGLHADQAWVAEQFTNTANDLTIDSYSKTNARITARSDDDKWRLALYATNLTNEEIVRNLEGSATYYWFQPRQIGFEVGYKM